MRYYEKKSKGEQMKRFLKKLTAYALMVLLITPSIFFVGCSNDFDLTSVIVNGVTYNIDSLSSADKEKYLGDYTYTVTGYEDKTFIVKITNSKGTTRSSTYGVFSSTTDASDTTTYTLVSAPSDFPLDLELFVSGVGSETTITICRRINGTIKFGLVFIY